MSYLAVLEHGPASWGAYVPDLPGCYAVAPTREEVERLIQEAVLFHLSGLQAEGEPIPPPGATTDFVAAGTDKPSFVTVFEKADDAWLAWVPDVPECRVRAPTREQAREGIAAALVRRFDELLAEHQPSPIPGTFVMMVATPGDAAAGASSARLRRP